MVYTWCDGMLVDVCVDDVKFSWVKGEHCVVVCGEICMMNVCECTDDRWVSRVCAMTELDAGGCRLMTRLGGWMDGWLAGQV